LSRKKNENENENVPKQQSSFVQEAKENSNEEEPVISSNIKRTAGGAFDEEEQYEEEQKNVLENNCPGKHGLKEFATPKNGSHSCDICQQWLDANSKMFGCRSCNFDLCQNCYSKPNPQNCVNYYVNF
jgi:hypothetical protein